MAFHLNWKIILTFFSEDVKNEDEFLRSVFSWGQNCFKCLLELKFQDILFICMSF